MIMISAAISLLGLLGGCGPKNVASEGPLPSIPKVPAPQAVRYSIDLDTPKDFLVSQVVRDFSWSEALSGAAAEVALKIVDRPIRLQDAQWAAIRAGFPYPVEQIIVGDVELDQYPKDLHKLLKGVSDKRMGVVRVRKGTMDRWVVLLSSDGPLTEGFSREIEPLSELAIEGVGEYKLLSPEGDISIGNMPFKQELSEGSWWFEVTSDRGTVSLPIYAGVGTPVHPLFITEDVGLEIAEPDRLEEDAFILFEDMRERQGLVSIFEDSSLLESFAEQALAELLTGTWNHQSSIDLLKKVGFVGGPVYQVTCQAESVYACLDKLSWTIEGRQALLDPGIRAIGLDVHVQTNGVAMVINLSAI